MVLNIKDAETDRLARALAVATGGSLTEAVREALAHRLAQLSGGVRREEMLAGMRRIGRDCAARMTPPFASEDHGDLLHDADGSPR